MANKKKVVVVGNCQARPIATLLEAMSEEIEVTKVAIVHLLNSEQEAEYKPFFEEADYIIAQLVSDNYPCEFVRSDKLSNQYGNKVIKVINLFFNGYFPDWRYLRIPTGGTLHGPMGDYHNSIIFHGWRNKKSIDSVIQKLKSQTYYSKIYMDADRASLNELVRREKNSDVNIVSYIKRIYKEKKLFFTFNHPTLELLSEYTKNIIAKLGLPLTSIKVPNREEPLDSLIISVIPLYKDLIGENIYQGMGELSSIGPYKYKGKKEYKIDFLVEEFYRFYDLNHGFDLKSLPATLDEKSVRFEIDSILYGESDLTEELAIKLSEDYILSSSIKLDYTDLEYIILFSSVDERIKARFFTLLIKLLVQDNKWSRLISLVASNTHIVRYPFVNAAICDAFFYNPDVFKQKCDENLQKIISCISQYQITINRLKIISVDNKSKFNEFRNNVRKYCDINNLNQCVIMFNAFLCYEDLKGYYLDFICLVEFKVGENDENYLSILIKLFDFFGVDFQTDMLILFLENKNIFLFDLIVSKSKFRNEIINSIELNESIKLEDKYLARRLLSTNRRFPSTKVKARLNEVKPKLAVCISGQLRGYKQTFQSINDALAPFFDFDVYISTWSSVGSRLPYPLVAADRVFEGSFLKCFKSVLSSGNVTWNDFCLMYPTLLTALQDNNSIDKDYINSAFKGANEVFLDIEDDITVELLSNQEKMYYKIARCYEMLEHNGKEEDYDFVLRARPDRKIEINDLSKLSDMLDIESSELFVDAPSRLHFFKGMTVGDTLAFGTPGIMSKYSIFYNHVKTEKIVIRPHNELAYYLYSLSIDTLTSAIIATGFYNPRLPQKTILEAIETDSSHRDSKVDKLFIEALTEDCLKK
ncbi:WcbI family polysaccharide biosynthesis putative acetyltransferase [Shewanella ulleungensis]|uniref:Polysaccharide biosynthesis enzyme WcbI domain-containing protein n=1 Tax=Shewanella ulleungensis TaxID=2282699 RepID=A0ABQ2QJV4_9GAMM|nr:WcbI family polysaccharide biosynthesis putative acetyltransferase [Shewanella ulleungensis]MCL1149851.1 hypothetical protein [Shewanella ulleungensis]GGP85060.1 hypothetical protein GCM10009410_17780 [Shewanella ulleungensis]